ncbi:hypothetical protein ACFSQZ_13590 [Rubritalea spongiae]|uniref:DUF4386 family protein n=1 Tax=Rubritalea spongiae TaxID=430797 RepID=A0ABW5E514_9BACT
MFFRKPRSPKPSPWIRIRRFSAYFTILGASLAGLRYYTIAPQPDIPHAARDNAFFMEQIHSIRNAEMNTFYLLCAFAIFNGVLFLISLIMCQKVKG